MFLICPGILLIFVAKEGRWSLWSVWRLTCVKITRKSSDNSAECGGFHFESSSRKRPYILLAAWSCISLWEGFGFRAVVRQYVRGRWNMYLILDVTTQLGTVARPCLYTSKDSRNCRLPQDALGLMEKAKTNPRGESSKHHSYGR